MERKTILAETERLILRRYRKSGLRDLLEYLADTRATGYEPMSHGKVRIIPNGASARESDLEDTFMYTKLRGGHWTVIKKRRMQLHAALFDN